MINPKPFEFNIKTKTRFGVGEALRLGEYLKELRFKRVGILIDKGVKETEYLKKILENIKEDNFDKVQIWEYDLGSEPDYDSLDKVKLEFLDDNSQPLVDCFVGIGGGSVIDFAKGLATLVVNPGGSRSYRGFPENINPSLPTIALPSTAGTGSEVTFNAVFVDKQAKKKLGINTHHNFPVLAILDPNLILSCPEAVTVSSGIDILVHVIEGYGSQKADPLTKIFARGGFELAFNNLAKVLDNPQNIGIRANLQLAAYLGGLTLLGSGGGPTGALSYLLGANFNVAHGIAGGVFLPHIVQHNVERGYDYSELYNLLEGVDKSVGQDEKNKIFAEKIFELSQKLGIPQNLKEFGVDEKNIDILLGEVKSLEKAFEQNPVPFSVEEGKQLLNKLIE